MSALAFAAVVLAAPGYPSAPVLGQPIDGFHDDVDRRVEAEREIGATEIVVNRLGNADHRQTLLLVQSLRDAQCVVAANRDELKARRARSIRFSALKDAELVPAGGSLGIPSLARSLLVRRKKPVAVVMDADSMNPEVIEERRESIDELLPIGR